MAAITAELLPDSAAVRLSINAPAGIRSITRTDANGVNDVRTGGGVLGVVPDITLETTNLIQNPSFETGVGTWGGTRSSISRYQFTGPYWNNYTPGPAGAYGLRLDPDGTLGSTYVSSAAFTVTPGRYIAAGAVASTAGGAFKLQLAFYDSANTTVSAVLSPLTGAGASVYNLQSAAVSSIVPSTATYAKLIVYYYTSSGANPPSTQANYMDRAIAVEATAEADAKARASIYHDGTYTPSIEYAVSWTGAAGASPSTRSTQSTPFIVTDYEAASGPLRYDVVDGNGLLESLDVTGFALDGPWLFTPIIPGYSRRAASVTGIDTTFEDLSTVHSGLLGRNDPIIVMRPMGMRSGVLEIYAGSYAEAVDILSPLKQAAIMMLRQPEHAGMDMYFAPAGGTPSIIHLTVAGQETTWGVRVPYTEVRRPEGELAGALGWTFADLTGAAARFFDLPRIFATFADMRLNARKTP